MSVTFEDQNPLMRRFVRYGIPLLILIFYVTASRHFNYSSEATYRTLLSVRDSSPESLWACLLSVAMFLKVDVLLAAKVFSLLFICLTILLSYLIAIEILRDYILSFCVALTFSMQAWLLEFAPSGSGAAFTLLLSLAAIFFLLRNEYIIAGVFAGLATLTLWQASSVVVIILVDIFLNSVDKRRATKLMVSIVLVFSAVLLPWALYSVHSGKIIIPFLYDALVMPPGQTFEATYILIVLAMIGIVYVLIRERKAIPVHAAVILWIGTACVLNVWLLAAPLIVIYAFWGLQKSFQNVSKVSFMYIAALLLTTAFLLQHQLVAFPQTRDKLLAATEEIRELKAIALWLRTNTKEDEPVHMPEPHQALLQFYSERAAGGIDSPYIVSRQENISGVLVFDPQTINEVVPDSAHYIVVKMQ